jgi:hypothetical protein
VKSHQLPCLLATIDLNPAPVKVSRNKDKFRSAPTDRSGEGHLHVAVASRQDWFGHEKHGHALSARQKLLTLLPVPVRCRRLLPCAVRRHLTRYLQTPSCESPKAPFGYTNDRRCGSLTGWKPATLSRSIRPGTTGPGVRSQVTFRSPFLKSKRLRYRSSPPHTSAKNRGAFFSVPSVVCHGALAIAVALVRSWGNFRLTLRGLWTMGKRAQRLRPGLWTDRAAEDPIRPQA